MKKIATFSIFLLLGATALCMKTQYPSDPVQVAKKQPPAYTWTTGPIKIDETTLREESTKIETPPPSDYVLVENKKIAKTIATKKPEIKKGLFAKINEKRKKNNKPPLFSCFKSRKA